MPPKPGPNETEEQFMSGCIRVVIDDESAESQEQAVAMCASMWADREKADPSPKRTSGPSERKTFPNIGFKVLDAEQGIVEHIITVFGVLDDGNDISHPGSFQQTITGGKGKNAKVLDSHNNTSIFSSLGVPVRLHEVSRAGLPAEILEKYPEATGGLKAETRFLLDTPEGHGAFVRLRDKAVDEWSYGYDAVNPDFTMIKNKSGDDVRARNLREIVLYEYSPVLWGMNPATATLGTKSADDAEKSADLPEAKVGRAISAARAERIGEAWVMLGEVLESAGIPLPGFDEPDDDEPEPDKHNALTTPTALAAASKTEAETPPDDGPVITSEVMVLHIEALQTELQLLEVQ